MFSSTRLSQFLVVSISSSAALSATIEMRLANRCGSVLTDAQVLRGENLFDLARATWDVVAVASAPSPSPAAIKVYWHVVSTPTLGNVTRDQITASITEMNRAYKNSGFMFNLVNTSRTVNPTWFNQASNSKGGNSYQTDMKIALRSGGPADLNIYSVGFTELDQVLLGYATFPYMYLDQPKEDGVVFLHSTTPGGSKSGYNTGKTLVHETGHWLGLYHTFQGGCDGGDKVADTAPEASGSFGCDVSRDSCPGDAFNDPVHNYMGYSDDDCLTEFTPGQHARVKDRLKAFRGLSL